jgi:hypothetical protein
LFPEARLIFCDPGGEALAHVARVHLSALRRKALEQNHRPPLFEIPVVNRRRMVVGTDEAGRRGARAPRQLREGSAGARHIRAVFSDLGLL